MSADNYIFIVKTKDGYYEGYMHSASCTIDENKKWDKRPYWTVKTMEEAIKKAQSEYTEYGYVFEHLLEEKE